MYNSNIDTSGENDMGETEKAKKLEQQITEILTTSGTATIKRMIEKDHAIDCLFLLAMDKGGIPPKGRLRNGPPRNLCHEYTDWCTEKVIAIRADLNL